MVAAKRVKRACDSSNGVYEYIRMRYVELSDSGQTELAVEAS